MAETSVETPAVVQVDVAALIDHARQELDLMGVEPRIAGALVAAVAAFGSCSPSTRQMPALTAMLGELVRHRPVSPLTANPAEWVQDGSGWVNRRDPRAVSDDRGRTYRYDDDDSRRVYTSAPPRGWVLALRERDALREEDAVAAVFEYLQAGELTAADAQMLAALPPGALRNDFLESRWGRRGAAVASLLWNDPLERSTGVGVQVQPPRLLAA